MTRLAYACINRYPEEARFFFHTVSSRYGTDYLDANFDLILRNRSIEGYQIGKLFRRKSQLLDRHRAWLERKHPSAMIYVAAIRGRKLGD